MAAALLLGISAACSTSAPKALPTDPGQSASQPEQAPVDAAVTQQIEALLGAATNPLDITLILQESDAAGDEVGPEGGTIQITTAGGATIRLSIPENALAQPVTIRMIPVERAVGLPFEGGIAVGVELEPNGLSLMVPATLTFELPEDIPPKDAWGVSTLAGGEQAAVYPAVVRGSSAELTLTGFSGYNVALGRQGAEALEERPVTSIGRRAIAYLEMIRHAAGARANESGLLEFTDEEWRDLEALAEQWKASGLEALRAGALADDVQFLRFTYELRLMLNVDYMLQAYYGESLWEANELTSPWEEPADRAIERATERCKTEHRFGELDWILELVQQKQLWGIDSDSTDFFEARRTCAVFRLSFESTITQRGTGEVTTNDQLMFLSGEVFDLVPDEYLLQDPDPINGPTTGALSYLAASGRSELRGASGVCAADTVGGIDSKMKVRLVDFQARPRRYGPWSAPEIYGRQAKPPGDPLDGTTRILFDPGDPLEQLHGDCLGDDPTVEVALWDGIFWLNHFSAVLEPAIWTTFLGDGGEPSDELAEDAGFNFELTEFEGGTVYATLTFDECQTTSGSGYSGATCERSFFVLYHEPLETSPGS